MFSGRRSLGIEEMLNLHLELVEFGDIVKLFFDYRHSTSGIVCKATFSFFTQAYLAKMLLEGQKVGNVLLSTAIEEREMEEEIIGQAKKCLMIAMESYFPNEKCT